MKNKISFILICLLPIINYGQTDTTKSVYSKLKTKKFYQVGTSFEIKNGKSRYELEGKVVNKKTYNKYHKTWKNMETCKPCILKTFDIKGNLLNTATYYTDCLVGQWIEYYPNGRIKILGHYKENDTGNWEDLSNRGYCQRKEGFWFYYDENGNITKTEKYINDNLYE